MSKLDATKLAEMVARDLPRLRAATVFTVSGSKEDAAPVLARWDAYLAKFCPPQRECICCGADLLGLSLAANVAMGGSFSWGIAHGEGRCSRCSYPARAVHDLGDDGVISNLILQYHPSEIALDAREAVTP